MANKNLKNLSFSYGEGKNGSFVFELKNPPKDMDIKKNAARLSKAISKAICYEYANILGLELKEEDLTDTSQVAEIEDRFQK